MRCTATAKRTGEQCLRSAIAGARTCLVHGSATKAARIAAARNVAEAKARAAIEAEAAKVARDAKPPDPLGVLEDALTDVVALKDRLRAIVAKLESDSLRYEGRSGEQLRGELQAYQAALRDTVKAAETMVRLGIAERRQALDEAMAMTLVTVIRAVLDDLGLSPDQRQIAAESVPRHLKTASSRPAIESGQGRTPVPAQAASRRPGRLADL